MFFLPFSGWNVYQFGTNVGSFLPRQGGPIFLADGFSRTELSLNRFGRGRESTMTEAHSRRYNVGLTYGFLGSNARDLLKTMLFTHDNIL